MDLTNAHLCFLYCVLRVREAPFSAQFSDSGSVESGGVAMPRFVCRGVTHYNTVSLVLLRVQHAMFSDSSQIRRIQGNQVRRPWWRLTPGSMESKSEDDDEGALKGPIHFLLVYVCFGSLRLFPITPLSSL